MKIDDQNKYFLVTRKQIIKRPSFDSQEKSDCETMYHQDPPNPLLPILRDESKMQLGHLTISKQGSFSTLKHDVSVLRSAGTSIQKHPNSLFKQSPKQG